METALGCHDTRRRAGARVTALIVFVVLGASALAVAMAVRKVDRPPARRADGTAPEDPNAETESPRPTEAPHNHG